MGCSYCRGHAHQVCSHPDCRDENDYARDHGNGGRWDNLESKSYVTAEAKLRQLIDKIESCVPYVLATVNPGSSPKRHQAPESHGGASWIEVHEGRANSSCRQLEALLMTAREFK